MYMWLVSAGDVDMVVTTSLEAARSYADAAYAGYILYERNTRYESRNVNKEIRYYKKIDESRCHGTATITKVKRI